MRTKQEEIEDAMQQQQQRRRPLTADEQRRVAETWPLARRVVKRKARRMGASPTLTEDFLSAASEALCLAARTFDPAIAQWGSHWPRRVDGAIRDVLFQVRAKGFGGSRRLWKSGRMAPVVSLDEPIEGHANAGRTASLADLVCLDTESGAVGWEIETDDERRRIATVAAGGNERLQRALSALLTRADCATMKAAGRTVGLSEGRISQVQERLREVAARRLSGC